jgi:hypothetical protein
MMAGPLINSIDNGMPLAAASKLSRAIRKQIPVITTARPMVLRKYCSRPSRAFKPKMKPSMARSFSAQLRMNSFWIAFRPVNPPAIPEVMVSGRLP